MPTILTPQGWVKVAPAPRKRQPPADPKVSLRGPLAYLACQRERPSLNVPGPKGGKNPFPYDLSANPENLRRQGLAKSGDRSVSTPAVMHGALGLNDDEEPAAPEPEIIEIAPSRAAPQSESASKSKHRSKSSRHHHHRHHHDDDNHSVSSSGSGSTTSSSSSASSSAPSSRSYTRHRPPVEARPRPNSQHNYYNQPPPMAGGYNPYLAPPPVHMHMPMAMPPSSGRSLSYSWYNATTPLNLNSNS